MPPDSAALLPWTCLLVRQPPLVLGVSDGAQTVKTARGALCDVQNVSWIVFVSSVFIACHPLHA